MLEAPNELVTSHGLIPWITGEALYKSLCADRDQCSTLLPLPPVNPRHLLALRNVPTEIMSPLADSDAGAGAIVSCLASDVCQPSSASFGNAALVERPHVNQLYSLVDTRTYN